MDMSDEELDLLFGDPLYSPDENNRDSDEITINVYNPRQDY